VKDIMSDKPSSEFEQAALCRTGGSLLGEFWEFLKQNTKWWILPTRTCTRNSL
jgi:hypothetical protein